MTTEPMQTHTLPEYGLSFTANKKYKTIINKISHFAKIKNFLKQIYNKHLKMHIIILKLLTTKQKQQDRY